MKFDVSSSELLSKLVIANGSIGSNPVLPILEDFLFQVKDNVLTISSTNLETSITTDLEVMSDGNGSVAVPAKILLDTLKELPEQPISFTVDEENYGIKLKSSYGEYKLSGDDPNDFPELPKAESTNEIPMSGKQLEKAINNTLFATSHDELRLAMTGVLMQIDYNKLILVATDAHKLVKHSLAGINVDLNDQFIVPKKALALVKNALIDEDIKVSFNKKNVFFDLNDTKIIARLIDAKYPDYNAVIPVDNPNVLTLGRNDFKNSLKRIVIYSNKTTNQVILSLSEGSLTISAQDLDFSNEATEQLSCQYTGEPITIGFNAKFLIEMLNVLQSDEIKFELSSPSRAGILFPSEQEEAENLLMLVMPVMMSH